MIRAWRSEGQAVREVPCHEALQAVLAGEANAWIDLEDESEEVVKQTLEPLAIHSLVLDDIVRQVNRPKVDNYGSYLYLVMHTARWDEDRPATREVDMVLGERYLITCHEGATRSVIAAHEVVPRRPDLLTRTPAYLLHFMLDVLVDHYLPITDRLGEEIDGLEDELFKDERHTPLAQILRLKRGMAALRRIIGPQRDTMLALTRDEFMAIPPEIRPYLRDVYDRLARVSDLLDSFRDESTTLLELQASVTSNRLNHVIKRLTVIATIGLPLTIVTSYYGMNFEFVEYHFRHAWAYAVGLLAATALITWWFLRRRDWL